MSKERLEALRKKKRLAELRAKQTGDLSETSSIKEATLAAGAGALQGATFGFADEVGAAIETGLDVAQEVGKEAMAKGLSGVDMNLAEIGEQYSRNLEDHRKMYSAMEEKHSVLYNIGDISGSILGSISTGGTGTLLGAGVKAGAKTLGISAVQGVAHGVGRAELKTIDETLSEVGTIGAVTDVAGTVAGAALGPVGKVVGKGAQKIGAESFLNYLGAHVGRLRTGLESGLKKHGKNTTEYASRMVKYTTKEGDPLIKGNRNPEELLDILKQEEQIAGEIMGDALKSIKSKPHPMDIHTYIRSSLDTSIEKAQMPDTIKALQEVSNEVDSLFFKHIDKGKGVIEEIPIERSVQSLHFLKSEMFDIAAQRGEDTLKGKATRQVANSLFKYIDNLAKEGADDATYKAYSSAKLKWGDLQETSKMLKHKLSQPDSSPMNVFKHFFTRNSVAALGISTATGMAPLPAAMTAIAVEKMATNSKVAAPVAKGLLKVSSAFKENPERWARASQQIVSASAISSDLFEEKLMEASAEVDLFQNPLPRTSEGVIRQKGSVLTMVGTLDKNMENALREAIDNKETEKIQKIMGSLSSKDTKGLVQPGIGWDGMAVTEEDTIKVNKWISGIKNTRKRMHTTKSFKENNQIPQDMMIGTEGQEPDKFFQFEKTRKGPKNKKF